VTRSGAILAVVAGLAAASLSSEARAEASAWASVSGGATGLKFGDTDFHFRGSLQFDAGVGTSPANVFIVGMIFRVSPIIEEGTDLSLAVRGATRGFQVGDWGFAVDAGPYLRTFGPDPLPTVGFMGGVVLGGPLGTQISILGHYGMDQAAGVSASFGIDLLRLTVYRQSIQNWWPNPMSAGAKTASAR
jgi:hypothetical protein